MDIWDELRNESIIGVWEIEGEGTHVLLDSGRVMVVNATLVRDYWIQEQM